MKILFINIDSSIKYKNASPQDVTPPVSCGYSISLLKKDGHHVFFINTEEKRLNLSHYIKESLNIAPEIIIISGVSSTFDLALKYSEKLKKHLSCFICAIDNLGTDAYKYLLFENSPIDCTCFGECEYTIKEIVSKINKHKDWTTSDGICFFESKIIKNKKRALIENLDSLPFPAHEFFLKKEYKSYFPIKSVKKNRWGFILAQRGCDQRCSFCASSLRVTHGYHYRRRSPDNIVKEMIVLKNNGINCIYFMDDNFISDKKWIIDLCKKIIFSKLKLRWVVQTRLDIVDKDILIFLKKAGCTTICTGVESGSQKVLNKINKNILVHEIERKIELIHKYKFLLCAFFIFGNPEETLDDVKKTIDLCFRLYPDMILSALLTPYPGSIIYEKYSSKISTKIKDLSHYNSLSLNLSNIPTHLLKKMNKRLYIEYFFSFTFLKRFLRYRFPVLFFNLDVEFPLIIKSLKYFFKKN